MKTKQIALITVSIILIIAIFTNPNQTTHIEKVKTTITSLYQKQLKVDETESNNSFLVLGSLLGTSLINTMVENGVAVTIIFFFQLQNSHMKVKKNQLVMAFWGMFFFLVK